MPAEATVAMWITGLLVPLFVAGMVALWRLGTKVEILKSNQDQTGKDIIEVKSIANNTALSLARIEGALGVKPTEKVK